VRSQIDSSYAALYVPWITTANPLAHAEIRRHGNQVPPSAFMAGVWQEVMRRTESENAGEPRSFQAVSLERNITFAEQGALNPRGINCIRYCPGRGYRRLGRQDGEAPIRSSCPECFAGYLIYLEHSMTTARSGRFLKQPDGLSGRRKRGH